MFFSFTKYYFLPQSRPHLLIHYDNSQCRLREISIDVEPVTTPGQLRRKRTPRNICLGNLLETHSSLNCNPSTRLTCRSELSDFLPSFYIIFFLSGAGSRLLQTHTLQSLIHFISTLHTFLVPPRCKLSAITLSLQRLTIQEQPFLNSQFFPFVSLPS